MDKKLFRKNGRTIELTDAGRLALDYADEIFSLGSELESAVRRENESGAKRGFASGSRMRCQRQSTTGCWNQR
ncbi:hypothetical protein P0D89_44650 [Paraburkholderia sp. RL18-085-BIA-A]